MLRLENVATPATAANEACPDKVPPLGFAPITKVIVPVNPLDTLPSASRAVTLTGGAITAPAAVALGCTVNVSCVAGPPVMLNALLELLIAAAVASSR